MEGRVDRVGYIASSLSVAVPQEILLSEKADKPAHFCVVCILSLLYCSTIRTIVQKLLGSQNTRTLVLLLLLLFY